MSNELILKVKVTDIECITSVNLGQAFSGDNTTFSWHPLYQQVKKKTWQLITLIQLSEKEGDLSLVFCFEVCCH